MKIFNNEKDIFSTLRNAIKLIHPKKGPILFLGRDPFYSDEPKLFHYTSVIKISPVRKKQYKDNFAGGSAIDKERAILKAASEGIERYALTRYTKKSFIHGSFRSLSQKLHQKYNETLILNPKGIVSFSSVQLADSEFKQFRVDEKSHLNWVRGNSLFYDKPIFVPAQLVYVPYFYTDHEPVIRFPITTGAATGSSLAGAIYRGICEVIERDAFMVNYLAKLPRVKIKNLPSKIQDLINILSRYHLKVYVFEFTTDLPIPVFAAIILDYSGAGPAISIGLKADLDAQAAILGALEEAHHTIPLARNAMLNKKDFDTTKIGTFEDRAKYWSTTHMINKLNFWLKTNEVKNFQTIPTVSNTTTSFRLKKLLEILQGKVSDIIFVDVTPKNVERVSFKVVKVIIPELQPLYLYEEFPYHGGKRLYKTPKILGFTNDILTEGELNSVPHPFL